MIFKLKIKQIDSICNFELTWNNAQTIDINLNYPFSLTTSYKYWHKAYLDYYQRLRGKVAKSGIGSIPINTHKQLVDAEAELLNEFQRWLLSPELVSIRREIANAANKASENKPVDVFLTCTPLDLARLPWETWDIGTDLGALKKIRIARTPTNITHQSVHPLQRKIKVLAIFGDDTGLNLEKDKKAVESLRSIVDVKFVGWKQNPEKKINKDSEVKEEQIFNPNALKNEIIQAISNQDGWDILFFIGHSNETALTGGEFGIAPGVALSIHEIADALKTAIKRGLQFAVFNSCNGINIAESLINLGLSQVAIMREPIHNQVAGEFLREFLYSLATYKDVHTALLDATQFLQKPEKRTSYPSSYLIPSLFRHPEAELFQIKPFDIWSKLKRWIPTQKEATWLGTLLFISLLPPVQSLLLEPRILLQAIYRNATFQKSDKVESPVLLVKIDNKSLISDKVKQRYPLDYSYLAKNIQKLSDLNAKLVGIDYILEEADKQPNATSQLRQVIRNATNQGTLFIFGSQPHEDPEKGKVSDKIASFNWSMQGNIYLTEWYVELPFENQNCFNDCPLAYSLALAYSLPGKKRQPSLDSKKDFTISLFNSHSQNDKFNYLKKLRLHPVNNLLPWFHPIVDFSIPPNQAYQTISTCELLGSCTTDEIPKNLDNKLVIIAPGGYQEAGLNGDGGDNATIPLAVAFWRGWENGKFPKGEAHAYMVHHLLKPHLVVPVPDFLMILLAALIAKGVTFQLIESSRNHKKIIKTLSLSGISYCIISLQLYISACILLPYFLPLLLFGNYIRLTLRRISDESI